MKIALLARRTIAHSIGGMENHTHWLASTLVDHGHQVHVVTTRLPADSHHAAWNYQVVEIEAPINRWSRAWAKETTSAVTLIAPDLIIGQSTSASHLAGSWPTVTHLHGDHLTEFHGVVALWRGGMIRKRRLLRRTWELVWDYVRWRPWNISHGVVIALSNKRLRSARLIYRAKRESSFVVGNPVRQSFRPSRAPRDRVITFSGRLDPSKGPQILLEAFARSRLGECGLTCIFAGDGPMRGELEERALGLGVWDEVTFLGSLDETELADLLSRTQVACFPSVGPESFSLALLEAMASGVLVIVSPNAGLSSICDHPMVTDNRQAGIEVPRNTVFHWSEQLCMVSAGLSQYQEIEQNAVRVAAAFSEQRIFAELHDIYSRVAHQ